MRAIRSGSIVSFSILAVVATACAIWCLTFPPELRSGASMMFAYAAYGASGALSAAAGLDLLSRSPEPPPAARKRRAAVANVLAALIAAVGVASALVPVSTGLDRVGSYCVAVMCGSNVLMSAVALFEQRRARAGVS